MTVPEIIDEIESFGDAVVYVDICPFSIYKPVTTISVILSLNNGSHNYTKTYTYAMSISEDLCQHACERIGDALKKDDNFFDYTVINNSDITTNNLNLYNTFINNKFLSKCLSTINKDFEIKVLEPYHKSVTIGSIEEYGITMTIPVEVISCNIDKLHIDEKDKVNIYLKLMQ